MTITKKDIEAVERLTPMQQGMLFQTLATPQSEVYFEQLSCSLDADLNVKAFEEAWQTAVDAHPILRSAFVWERQATPMRVVFRAVRLPWKYLDWRELNAKDQSICWAELLAEERSLGFDLNRPPLMRCVLVRLQDRRYRFVWNHHHLLLDGWSVPLLMGQVIKFYDTIRAGRTVQVEPSPPFENYLRWIESKPSSEPFWREALADFDHDTPLALALTGANKASVESHEYRDASITMPPPIEQKLRDMAKRSGLTLASVVEGALFLLLSRVTGRTDIIVGTTVSGRPPEVSGVEQMIGMFINTLPLRMSVDRNVSLTDWLVTLQSRFADVRERSETALTDLRIWADQPAWTALFETIFVFENYPVAKGLSEQEKTLRIDDVHASESTGYPLTIVATPQAGLTLKAIGDTGYFSADALQRFLDNYRMLLESIAEFPDDVIGAYEQISNDEQSVLADLSRGPVVSISSDSLSLLFADVVRLHGSRVAIECGDVSLSYAELSSAADGLALHLRDFGVSPGDLVGVRLERTVSLVVSFLAILKAGAAYLPLDLAYPPERVGFMLTDSGAKVVISDAAHKADLPTLTVRVLDVADYADGASVEDVAPVGDHVDGSYPAYVMYTSGSTGTPKGVVVSQRAVMRLSRDSNYITLYPGDRIAQVSNSSFDAATFEIWGALLNGATLVMLSRDEILDGPVLAEALARERIDSLFLTTALFNQVARHQADGFKNLRDVLFGGEVVDTNCVSRVLGAGAPQRLVHVYGPTENTTFSTWHEFQRLSHEERTVPIGKALTNSSCHVLDAQQCMMPRGTVGELYLGGAGLADGYWQRPALTAERFVPDPFSNELGARLYRTGDLVRWNDAGALEFVGRSDGQIKLRGMRIELGEIEAALLNHAGVSEAVAVVLDAGQEAARLVGYWVASSADEITIAALRQHLTSQLPAFAVPAALVRLDQLPLNANGKLERRALPRPTEGDLAYAEMDSEDTSKTPLMEIIGHVWGNVLGVEQVLPADDFFSLGGHSLLATRVISRLRLVLGIDVPIRALFEASTLATFALRVESERRRAAGTVELPLEALPRTQPLELSYAQQRLWFLEQVSPLSPAYYINLALTLKGALQSSVLDDALNDLRVRHEALRTGIVSVNGEARQQSLPVQSSLLRLVDLSSRPADLNAEMVSFAQEPFDLPAGDVFRAALFALGSDHHVLAIAIHHIAADGWSLGIFSRELSAFYEARLEGREAVLEPLPVQYGDFAVWQRRWLQGSALHDQLDYWRRQLDQLPTLELPTDHVRPAVLTYGGAVVRTEIKKAVADRLVAFGRAQECTLFMVLLAAYQAVLGYYSGQDDIVVGSPVANRNRAEVEGLIGFFVNMLVMRTDLSGDPNFPTLLKRVRESTLDAYAHQDVPFELVVDAVAPARVANRHPLFQTHFALQTAAMEAPRVGDLNVEPIGAEVNWVRFDLECHLWHEEDGAIRGSWVYNTDLFDLATVQRFERHLNDLLTRWAEQPALPLSRAIMPEIRETLANHQTLPVRDNLVLRFAAAMQAHNQRTALTLGKESLSYAELNSKANRLAHQLIARGVGAEVRVGLAVERSLELLIGLLAILKAGGVYVPLDPNYPVDRIAYMAQDAGVILILTDANSQSPDEAIPVVDISAAADTDYPDSDPGVILNADQAAYVIYTSGSTGQPKGVVISHRNVLRLIDGCQDRYGFDQNDVWTLFHSYAFDFSVWEIWGALLHGGRLVVVPYAVSRSPQVFLDLLVREQVTVLNQTPTAFYGLVRADLLGIHEAEALALRYVIFGGEALDFTRLLPWYRRHGDQHPALVNMYGITETTVHVTWHWLTEGMAKSDPGSSVGEPLPDLSCYILDPNMQPLGIGAPGELYVAGGGIARGYLNRPALTAERFIPDPFAKQSGARMYRTGDLARRRGDGSLEYLGRGDQQVQLRGHRIELGEIEALLTAQPGVATAAVACQTINNDDKRINAFVVDEVDDSDLVSNKLVAQWREIYESTYATGIGNEDFDITGWNSSFTGIAIPPEQMREWLDQTVHRIQALRPRRVLEIGCGTGMILFGVAPHCEHYYGLDLSPSVIERLREKTAKRGLSNVTLVADTAESIENLAGQSFDVVIINSVIQYFPSADYLMRILNAAVRISVSGGTIFIGDVRSLPLLPAFYAAITCQNVGDAQIRKDLQREVKQKKSEENELVLAPSLFTSVAKRQPRISSVGLALKRGHGDNEMNRFRYDAYLHIDGLIQEPPQDMLEFSDPNPDSWRKKIENKRPLAVTLRGLVDARTMGGVVMSDWLKQKKVGRNNDELDNLLKCKMEHAQHPEDLAQWAESLGYDIAMFDSLNGPGFIDAVLIGEESDADPAQLLPLLSVVSPPTEQPFANDPMRPIRRRNLAQTLREAIGKSLPDYMQPGSYTFLEQLPLTPSGKFDRDALPLPDTAGLAGTGVKALVPETDMERDLCDVWSEVLGIEACGVTDSFFELGGHSLLALQLVSRIRAIYKVEIPLNSLFADSSVRGTAAWLESQDLAVVDNHTEIISVTMQSLGKMDGLLDDLTDEQVDALLTSELAMENSTND